jgi:hypothetical protein
MFLGLESPFDTSFLGSPGCTGKMTAASAEWAQYATAPRQRPMLVAYSGCIAQINITRLLAPGPGISLKGPVYFAQEFKCIGMCWLCKRSPVIWAPAVRGRLLEHGMLTFWNVFESCVIHLVCFSVVSSAF